MSYQVQFLPRIGKGLNHLGVSDFVLVEVYLQVEELLGEHPWQVLQRTETPFAGMTLAFTLIDPENRLCVHAFSFQIVYGQDEQTLFVVRGFYQRQIYF